MKIFKEGQVTGLPIAVGYFAVSFALGIAMADAGLNPFEGFMMSFLNLSSAGEYAATQVIASNGSYIEMALVTLIANARYMLMSCSLSQKFSPDTKDIHRYLVGYAITDEHFAIAIQRPGYFEPTFMYGAMSLSIPAWSIGTALGIVCGEVLPVRLVSALSVALYGMFLAIIIPPCKEDKVILTIVISGFVLSYLCSILPIISTISSGTRILLLTVIIAGIAAYVKPIKGEIK